MKQFIFGCVATLAMLLPKLSQSQMPDTNKIDGFLQYVMQPLNKTQVTSGYLEEYGLPVIPMATYNGTLGESNYLELNLWRLLYFQLYTGYCQNGTNAMTPITTVNNVIKQNDSAHLPTPLAVLIGQYNTVKSNAFNTNLLSYNAATRQVNDVPGRTQSPYENKRLFAAAPTWQYSRTGTESFVFKPNMVWGNSSLTVTQMQVDFKNGEGFKTMQPNVPVSVIYADTGYYAWTIKATLSDNSIAECYAEYFVLYKQSTQLRYETPNIAPPQTWQKIAPVNGVHSGGNISIIYSTKQPSGTLRKPLIVIENMDANGIAPSLQRRQYTIVDFITSINQTSLGAGGYDLNNELDFNAGYDLVFINFNDGVDAIERNAAVVTEAILRVNANKVFDTRSNRREQNVVLGMGTGGLNARYALAQYTKANATTQISNPTETRLLITHDAPHRGQNIALGLQHLSRMLGSFSYFGVTTRDIFPNHAETVAYLNAPVNQQTLIYRATSDDANTINTFINNVYQPMVNYSAPYRFVPTSLGNECANQLFVAGRLFMEFDQGIATGTKVKVALGLGPFSINLFQIPLVELKYECKVYARSIPNPAILQREIAKLTTAFKLTLFGFIPVNKWGYDKTVYAPTTYLGIDGVPGSINTILDFKDLRNYQAAIGNTEFSQDQLLYSLYIPKTPFTLKFYAFVKAYQNNSGIFTTQYTALPVGSALDVSPFDAGSFTAKFVGGANPGYPSPANTYIAQESVAAQSLYNNASMRFTARNARFLFNEMEGTSPNNEICSQECQQTGFNIAGVGIFCTGSQTYRINGLPPNGTVTWSVTPAGIVSSTVNADKSITLQKIQDGVITLSASLSSCNQTTPLSIKIAVGTPIPEEITGPDYDLCFNGTQNTSGIFYTANSSPLLTYNWQIDGIGAGAGASISVRARIWGVGYHSIRVRTYSSLCGFSQWYESSFAVVDCSGFRFSMSPNPASGNVTITADNMQGAPKIEIVEIVSKTGVLLLTQKFKSASVVTIPTNNLTSDLYVVRIFDGAKWTSLNLSIVK